MPISSIVPAPRVAAMLRNRSTAAATSKFPTVDPGKKPKPRHAFERCRESQLAGKVPLDRIDAEIRKRVREPLYRPPKDVDADINRHICGWVDRREQDRCLGG